MLVALHTVPSVFMALDTDTTITRSQILRAILQHNLNIQHISKRVDDNANVVSRIDCCPAETHFIHLRGGISREGKVVELYRNYRTVQKFYETSCRPEVKDRPCSLIDEKIQHFSRCVQKYNYVYAFVKDYNVSENYRLDYIRIKSGCSCQVEFTFPFALDLPSQSSADSQEPSQ